jgi:rhodanese-related sulfurtransferase/mono/diheme cytochrome c family protein
LCHGEQGEGYRADHANALSNQDFLSAATDDFLRAAVARGRPGTTMSAWGQELGAPLANGDIDSLVQRMRAWQKESSLDLSRETVRGDPDRGRPAYLATCAGCHGREGQGVTAVSLNNPVFLETASDAYIRHAIARGRRGTKMRAFEPSLSPSTLDDLVSVVRAMGVTRSSPGGSAAGRVTGHLGAQVLNANSVLNPDGPAPGFQLRQGRFVAAAEVYQALTGKRRLILVDARPPPDFARGHIPGAINVPFFDATSRVAALPNDGTWVIAYCGCPHAESGVVVDALRAHGFPHTAVLDEGVFVWERRGYPMVGSVGR